MIKSRISLGYFFYVSIIIIIFLRLLSSFFNILQLSDHKSLYFICVSISTRHIGQCLLVTNHWSTQSRWNKCMHGKRLKMFKKNVSLMINDLISLAKINYLTSLSISNWDKQIVHFSLSSSASLERRSFLYLWGKVLISIVSYLFKKNNILLNHNLCKL